MHTHPYRSVSWSCDGRLLAASSDSGTVFLYDVAKGFMVKVLKQHTKQSLRCGEARACI